MGYNKTECDILVSVFILPYKGKIVLMFHILVSKFFFTLFITAHSFVILMAPRLFGDKMLKLDLVFQGPAV